LLLASAKSHSGFESCTSRYSMLLLGILFSFCFSTADEAEIKELNSKREKTRMHFRAEKEPNSDERTKRLDREACKTLKLIAIVDMLAAFQAGTREDTV